MFGANLRLSQERRRFPLQVFALSSKALKLLRLSIPLMPICTGKVAVGQTDGEHMARAWSIVAGDLSSWWYRGTLVHMTDDSKLLIERVQTGVRIEKRILKVLKAFAEYHDMTLGDVLEGIVLHAFDGKTPFSAASLERIRELKKFYELDLDSSASHRLREIKANSPGKRSTSRNK